MTDRRFCKGFGVAARAGLSYSCADNHVGVTPLLENQPTFHNTQVSWDAWPVFGKGRVLGLRGHLMAILVL